LDDDHYDDSEGAVVPDPNATRMAAASASLFLKSAHSSRSRLEQFNRLSLASGVTASEARASYPHRSAPKPSSILKKKKTMTTTKWITGVLVPPRRIVRFEPGTKPPQLSPRLSKAQRNSTGGSANSKKKSKKKKTKKKSGSVASTSSTKTKKENGNDNHFASMFTSSSHRISARETVTKTNSDEDDEDDSCYDTYDVKSRTREISRRRNSYFQQQNNKSTADDDDGRYVNIISITL
jgi:hypothetical protein